MFAMRYGLPFYGMHFAPLTSTQIIALHVATAVGGAEFYPSCVQIRVGGDGTGVPDASQEVSFPGGYKDTDPGIFYPDVSTDSCAQDYDANQVP